MIFSANVGVLIFSENKSKNCQKNCQNLTTFFNTAKNKGPQIAYVCVYNTDYTLAPHLFEFGSELIQALDNLLQ
jgi:hypothetical protein